MDDSSGPSIPPVDAARILFSRLLAIGENRFNLLVVEAQEGRDHFLNLVFHALAALALGLLCGIAWSAAVVILLWPFSPALTLLVLGAVYGVLAVVLCRRLALLRRQQQTLAATLDQLRKDRACLEEK